MNDNPLQYKGNALGFDFGQKRVGVAIGNFESKLAHPLQTIQEERNDRRFQIIEALIQEWQPSCLVVGQPTYLDGEAHYLTQQSQRFARRLEGRFKLPVILVDERLTSAMAEQALHEIGLTSKKAKPFIDQVAAQHILQAFLDDPLYGKPAIT